MADQAEVLRQMVQGKTTKKTPEKKVIAIASGKGGVGKSNFCINFALKLMKYGKKPIVLDLDAGFSNIELLLGTKSKKDLLHVIKGASIWEVIQSSPSGLPFISVGNDLLSFDRFTTAEIEHLTEEIKSLHEEYDMILLDSGAGLSEGMRSLIGASDELILLTTPEPTSISDGYSLLKFLYQEDELPLTHLVINRASSFIGGKATTDKMKLACEQFLGHQIFGLGSILSDESVNHAVMQQTPFVVHAPDSMASKCVDQIAKVFLNVEIQTIDLVSQKRKGLGGFLDRVFKKK